jgi:hypothetical protein
VWDVVPLFFKGVPHVPSSLTVVVDGGLVQTVIVEDWPTSLPLPRIVVVDYDVDGASGGNINCTKVRYHVAAGN